jgi:class 3 adenylate cyclase
MDSRGGDRDDPGSNPSQTEQPDSVTRGFLFSDLRAYTDFVETHGAAAAASLLERYRTLVREAVQHFGGAEIKTEGDSFYVVFNSVSGVAVRCGLAITRNAMADALEHRDQPISVGVGVHAGETIETAEGYVGSPVNIAARICSQAGPNEVLVSETARSLTRTVLPVRFEARGRRQLKGVAEPVALFSVIETGAGPVPWAKPQKLHPPPIDAGRDPGRSRPAAGDVEDWAGPPPQRRRRLPRNTHAERRPIGGQGRQRSGRDIGQPGPELWAVWLDRCPLGRGAGVGSRSSSEVGP